MSSKDPWWKQQLEQIANAYFAFQDVLWVVIGGILVLGGTALTVAALAGFDAPWWGGFVTVLIGIFIFTVSRRSFSEWRSGRKGR